MTENKDKYCANGRCNESKNGPVDCAAHKVCPDYTPDEHSVIYHPTHYQGSHECIDLMEAMFGTFEMMIFCKINAYKYRFRTGAKPGVDASEDKKKAEYYEDKYMEYKDRYELEF